MNRISFSVLFLGIPVTLVLTAANVYLGLYAGMTVSASIPAAVAGMGVFRLLRRQALHQSNLIQTMASAGESLAAGTLFTVPALVLVGAWKEFYFWQTSLIALGGGMLGVFFMIPLRRVLIAKSNELTYPEGVACAAVLRAGERSTSGLSAIALGAALGAMVKFFSTGTAWLAGSVEWAGRAAGRVFYLGSDISPALLAVGYIIKLPIAALVFTGGALGWLLCIPLLSGAPGDGASALESAWALWSAKVRYLGVGAMLTGGVWSVFSVRKGIAESLRGLAGKFTLSGNGDEDKPGEDIPMAVLLPGAGACLAVLFILYSVFIKNTGIALLALLCMVAAAFLFSAVSSYITGLVGSSNNPVSGMTISALLGTAGFFLLLGFRGQPALLATLGVAAVVCCAACTAGDCSQDLKTGHLLGTPPGLQQWSQIIGVVCASFVIAPVLTLLHHSYGIGDEGLKAPQATLFAKITQGLFGEGQLPFGMVGAGVALGVAVIVLDQVFKARGASFRLHLMPLAVGIYLPFSLAVPIMLGGLAHYLAGRINSGRRQKSQSGRGVLLGSGLIAGEALMGIVLAVFVYAGLNLQSNTIGAVLKTGLSLLALAGLLALLIGSGSGDNSSADG